MIATFPRKAKNVIRHRRLRQRLSGTAERPRVAVYRSNQHIQVQAIDDVLMKTLFVATDHVTTAKQTKTERARAAGEQLAEGLKKAGVTSVVFDRGGYLFHGRVKAVLEALRDAGLTV